MSYCTLDDLTGRFGDELAYVASDDNGSISELIVQQAIDDTDGVIDGYLAKLYRLPLPSIPGLLRGIACDIARYKLLDQRPSEESRVRYEDALRQLREINSGQLVLALPRVNSTGHKAPQTISVQSSPARWARNKSGGFI